MAGFSESIGFSEIDNFFEKPVNYEKIKSACKNFVIINSDNDPYVPLAQGKVMQDKFDAKFIVLSKADHINMGSGHFTLPIAPEEVFRIAE